MKSILEFIKAPKIWFFALVTLLFAAALAGTIVVLIAGSVGALAYVLYALTAILLGYEVYCVVCFAPKAKSRIKTVAMKYCFTRKLIEQYGFRTAVFAFFSLAISLINAAFNGYIGIAELSLWYISLFVYYLLLAIMRGVVLLLYGKGKDGGGAYIFGGIMLILLPIALSGVIFAMYLLGTVFVKAGLLIYLFAAYVFYKIIMSVVNLVKAKKTDLITVKAIRNINFADVLVSMLALQTALFHEFSPESNLSMGNAIMGAVICAATFTLGVFMIVKGKRRISSESPCDEITDK